GSSPFLWTADDSLANAHRHEFSSLTESGGPMGTYTTTRGVALVGSRVLVERALEGATPTAWLAGFDARAVQYPLTGTPVDLAVSGSSVIVVGSLAEVDGQGILWRDGVMTDLAAVPIDLDETGNVAVARMGGIGGGPASIVVLGFGGGFADST